MKPGRMAWRRAWNSLGADFYKTMLGLVGFTTVIGFVVLGYAWSAYVDDVQRHSLDLLTAEYRLPRAEVQSLLVQAKLTSQQTLDVPALVPLAKFGALLYLMFPLLLAWWAARRFAHPLTQLSLAAQQWQAGEFSARVPISRHLEQRSDETARLLKDFNVMAGSLERLERERQYSVAAVAHELRTPVTVLRGRLEGVRDGVFPATPQEIEKLIGHADLLARLIEDLQLLSLAEAGALRLERGRVDVRDMLTRLCGDYLPRAQAQGVHLALKLPPERVAIHADQRRFGQVLSNVMNNALRHTPPHGTVQIGADVQGQRVTIQIHNTGSGFTPEALSRGFERFYSTPDRERGRGGSGLGLAIAQSLVQAHGGSIQLMNVEGGASVRIRLKMVSETSARPSPGDGFISR